MDKNLRELFMEAAEECLDAQLRAVRRLRKGLPEPVALPRKSGMSQLDMTENILTQARKPLHINEIIERIQRDFDRRVDRESLVSALAKKVAREDRFVRTGKNTFALKERAR